MPAKKLHTPAIIRVIVLLLIVPVSVTAWPRQPERGYRGFVDWDNLAYISISLHESGRNRNITPEYPPHTAISSHPMYISGQALQPIIR